MKIEQKYILQLNKGMDVRTQIIDFAKKHQILFAQISAIGMLENFSIGYWNFHKQMHTFSHFVASHELTSFLGSISYKNDQYDLHAHVTLSDHQFHVVGGHFGDGQVSILMQCVITIISKIN